MLHTCKFKREDCVGSRMRWLLPLLARSLIGGSLLIFLYLLALVLMGGRPILPALRFPFESKTVDESEKIDHDICGNWSLIPSWSLMKEASLKWTKMMGHAVPDRADTPAPLGWKKQCGRSCWSLCMAVAVETAETMMTRIRKKTVEKSVLRLRQGLEEWIFPQGKAARRENPEADALWCMCQCCSTILWLRRNRRCTRARATGSLLPSCQPVWPACWIDTPDWSSSSGEELAAVPPDVVLALRDAVSRSCVDDFWTIWSKSAEAGGSTEAGSSAFRGRGLLRIRRRRQGDGAVGRSGARRLYRVSHCDEVDVCSTQYFVNSSLAPVLLFRRRLKSVADVLKEIGNRGFTQAWWVDSLSFWDAVCRHRPCGPICSLVLPICMVFISGSGGGPSVSATVLSCVPCRTSHRQWEAEQVTQLATDTCDGGFVQTLLSSPAVWRELPNSGSPQQVSISIGLASSRGSVHQVPLEMGGRRGATRPQT